MGRLPETLFRLSTARVETLPSPKAFPPQVIKFMGWEMAILDISLDAAKTTLLVQLGNTKSYVVLQGEEQRLELAGKNPQWNDVCLVYQTDDDDQYIGWGAIALPNPQKCDSPGPFVANIEINKDLRRQGHGMRLASLLHRLSQTFWGQPVGSGPIAHLKEDGEKLIAAFIHQGWMEKVSTDPDSEFVGTG